jgi:tRNA A37 threonylcarbamoyladenosine synthetase subunit TsaC/SUA5/YrdC
VDKNKVYLTQADTTVGFLSNDDKKLATIKNRDSSQKTLRVVDSFRTLKTYTHIPKKYKKLIRNSKNTTFIYPNGESFRVIDKNNQHYKFIKKFGILYSTSANKNGENFNEDFAIMNCDIEVLNDKKYLQSNSSNIIKVNNKSLIKVR